jgi:glycosyltransferase involved in cell wall biosynthesis
MKIAHFSDIYLYFDSKGNAWSEWPILPPPQILISLFGKHLERFYVFGRITTIKHLKGDGFLIAKQESKVEPIGVLTNSRGLSGYLFNLVRYLKTVKKTVQESDVLWLKIPMFTSFLAFFLRKKKQPFILEVIGDPQETAPLIFGRVVGGIMGLIGKRLMKTSLKNSEVCFFRTKYLAKKYGRPDAEIVKGALIEEENICKQPKPRPNNPPVIVYVGRLMPEKGPQFLLQAIHNITKKREVYLWFIGDGPLNEELQEMCQALDMEDKVKFFGRVKWGEDLFQLMRKGDILCVPSLSEGFPRVIIEGMANGLPVIASDVGGIGEAIKDGYNGLLVPPGDVNKLEEAIDKLLSNDKLWFEIAANGIETAREYTINHQLKKITDALTNLYLQQIKR